jgi:hypothetical protein
MMLSQQLSPEHLPAYIRCWQTLRTYPLSMVEVRDKDLADVCIISALSDKILEVSKH